MVETLVVGRDILNKELLRHGSEENLKNSTFDLTIGHIIPVGQKNEFARGKAGFAPQEADRQLTTYMISPREMVFILSKEEFKLPATVTGLASLRTTFTKKGLLALNVGFIDPFFEGPISTALINFSDRPVEIRTGEKFFRVVFFEHADVTGFQPKPDESVKKEEYIRELEIKAYSEFPQTYLNAPILDNEFYRENFYRLVTQGLFHTKTGRSLLFVAGLLVFLNLRHIPELPALWQWIKNFLP